MCQKWFVEFLAGDFLLNVIPWSGGPVENDSDQIPQTLIDNHQSYAMWEITDILKISKSSVENLLHQLSYVNSFDVCVPHKLSK